MDTQFNTSHPGDSWTLELENSSDVPQTVYIGMYIKLDQHNPMYLFSDMKVTFKME